MSQIKEFLVGRMRSYRSRRIKVTSTLSETYVFRARMETLCAKCGEEVDLTTLSAAPPPSGTGRPVLASRSVPDQETEIDRSD